MQYIDYPFFALSILPSARLLSIVFYFPFATDMKRQDTDSEDPQPEVTQSSQEAPSAEGATETCAAAKDSVESGSPKESEPATPQSDTPPQSDEAGGEGAAFIIFHINRRQML